MCIQMHETHAFMYMLSCPPMMSTWIEIPKVEVAHVQNTQVPNMHSRQQQKETLPHGVILVQDFRLLQTNSHKHLVQKEDLTPPPWALDTRKMSWCWRSRPLSHRLCHLAPAQRKCHIHLLYLRHEWYRMAVFLSQAQPPFKSSITRVFPLKFWFDFVKKIWPKYLIFCWPHCVLHSQNMHYGR